MNKLGYNSYDDDRSNNYWLIRILKKLFLVLFDYDKSKHLKKAYERLIELALRIVVSFSFITVLIVATLYKHHEYNIYSDDFNIWLTTFTEYLVNVTIGFAMLWVALHILNIIWNKISKLSIMMIMCDKTKTGLYRYYHPLRNN